MPCRGPEDDPNLNPSHECRAARLLVWASHWLGRETPVWAYAAANHVASRDRRATATLCALMRELAPDAREALLAEDNGPQARELARWWREHRRWDRRCAAQGTARG